MDAILNQPPQIAEDTICYRLYLPQEENSKAEAESLSTVIQTFVENLLPGHLWNRDSFELKPVQDQDPKHWILQGVMRVGDCVDDEWLVVWLLKQITAKWSVAASVYDTDGEFLLIEAAELLPNWITPLNATNRVWIYQSELHIVPVEYTSLTVGPSGRLRLPGRQTLDEDEALIDEDGSEGIDLRYALSLVRDVSVDTKASINVQNAVWQRCNGYPADARQHIQYSSAYLPVDVARALSRFPFLVQKAVEAFYTRDALQIRHLHKMERFAPESSVLHTVKLTRTAYAQLLGQKFHQPKLFGFWAEREDSKEWKRRDIGMKIACGFEILYQESKNRVSLFHNASKQTSLDALRDGLERSSDYQNYVATLQSVGYFGNEARGSSKWRDLEHKAILKFVEMHREDDAKRPSFATMVQSALEECPLETFHPSTRGEDSDSWLDLDVDEFEKLMPTNDPSTQSAHPATQDEKVERHASQLKDLASKVQAFVDGQGSLEGALFEDEVDSDDDSDVNIDGFPEILSETESASDHGVDDASRQSAMASLVPALDPSEYGRMPHYYSNSQAVASSNSDNRDMKPQLESLPNRAPLLSRDKFDGVDSDDETDSEEERLNQLGERDGENSDSEEDRPQVVGEVEIDMAEEEEEFIRFSREALGIDQEMWESIVKDRKARGAFVPLISESGAHIGGSSPNSSSQPNRSQAKNPRLDSFEEVMQAMEEKLEEHRSSKTRGAKPLEQQQQQRGMEHEPGVDIERLLDEELKESLQQESDDEDDLGDAGVDYNLIKNFLESFKGQAGLSGPVGNLAGRLQPDWKLPRDDS